VLAAVLDTMRMYSAGPSRIVYASRCSGTVVDIEIGQGLDLLGAMFEGLCDLKRGVKDVRFATSPCSVLMPY